MLITNYFQVRNVNPLHTEVLETLRELNKQEAGNPVLQEQIRQLDLMARQAYFGNLNRLTTGIYILLGMLAVFVLCTRFYFAKYKDIPDKEIDPIDEWAIKSQARKYVIWGVSGLAAVALVFAVLSMPNLRLSDSPRASAQNQLLAEVQDYQGSEEVAFFEEVAYEEATAEITENATETVTEIAVTTAVETPRVTHNAFRGNNGNGISSARGLATSWNLSTGKNIAWRTEIPRKGMSSPVISGNRVFITGADEQARELYAFDLTTGELLWTLAATNIPGSPAQVSTGELYYNQMLAASTPATNGSQVIAVFATGDIIAADMEGNRLWARNLGVPDNHYGYSSSPIIFGNLVIIQYDNHNASRVVALDIHTGAERWNTPRTERITWSSPIIAFVNNSPQLILMGNPHVTAYNPNNGAMLWQVRGMTGEVGASAASAGGIIFAASEYARLLAIDGATGTILWESRDFLPETASPVATRDNVYIATGYGVVASFCARTGALRVEHDFPATFYSSPMIAEGRIYLFDTSGKMYIFAANDDFTLLNSFETGERTYATPAFTDGKIVVRTDNSIYAVVAR